jgi:hypothetical protein
MWGRKKRTVEAQPEPPVFERDDRVPLPETWLPVGASGTIGRGLLAGLPVLAVLEQHPEESDDFEYRLWLPEPEMMTADGSTFLMYSSQEGAWLADGSCRFIDLLTRELDVTWSVRAEDFVAAKAWYNRDEANWIAAMTPRERRSWASIGKYLQRDDRPLMR